jgi:hypothetical protein
LDRANLNLQHAKLEKERRRSVNARAKKNVIETADQFAKFQHVKQKISKIRSISKQKTAEIELRR